VSSTIPEIMAEVTARLQGITLANGYQTDVTSVHDGDELIGIDESVQPTYIAVSLLEERDMNYSQDRAAKLELSVLVLGFLEAGADLAVKKQAFTRDVRKALGPWAQRPLNGKAVSIDQFRATYPPPERGAALATVDISFSITYVERITAPA
jgi:predicted DNA-binding protein (UPF0251 family)